MPDATSSRDKSAPWWREMHAYHWWVLLVATLGWLFDSMDQRLFVLARTPALRELLPHAGDAEIASHAGYATSIFILGWATGGLIFGLFGDRWGRTRTMMVTSHLFAVTVFRRCREPGGFASIAHAVWGGGSMRRACGG
jgi:MFS family permease